jgi:hypothetical protein
MRHPLGQFVQVGAGNGEVIQARSAFVERAWFGVGNHSRGVRSTTRCAVRGR